MPRRRRVSKRRHRFESLAELDLAVRLDGEHVPEAERQRVWGRERERTIGEHARHRPGTRPAGFWEFDARGAIASGAGELEQVRWLIEHGQLEDSEAEAILDREQWLIDAGYRDSDPYGNWPVPHARAEAVRAAGFSDE